MTTPRLRLGQLLVDAKLIAQADLDEVLTIQKEDGRRLGTLLVERKLINETQLTQILSHQLAVPWVSLLHIEFSRQLLNLVPHDVAERFCLVPIYVRHVRGQGETLYLAMEDPTNEDGLVACTEYSGLPVRAMIAPPEDIRSAIRVYYGGGSKPPEAAASRPGAVEIPAAAPAPEEEVPVAKEPSVPAPPPEPVAPPVAPPPARKEPEAPHIEAVEIDLKRRGRAERQEEAPASERSVEAIPRPKGRGPRMVSLTLLDGTTITLPAKPRRARDLAAEEEAAAAARASSGEEGPGLTARDLVAALRAVSHGADASEILGSDVRWEAMFGALLSLLLKKHLIADWEFVDELKKMGQG